MDFSLFRRFVVVLSLVGGFAAIWLAVDSRNQRVRPEKSSSAKSRAIQFPPFPETNRLPR